MFGGHIELFSFDIQRGRDHGLPGYNAWRRFCNLSTAHSFSNSPGGLVDHPKLIARKLSRIYNSPDDIDFLLGGLTESAIPGQGIVGPLFKCVIALQFKFLKDGDRFWYENYGEEGFSLAQLNEIRKTSHARILLDNSHLGKLITLFFFFCRGYFFFDRRLSVRNFVRIKDGIITTGLNQLLSGFLSTIMKTGKIVKENQPRPLPSSGNKTSGKSSANSRRKLEFKEKLPLAGKKIYLDLKGVRQEKKVEEKLEQLGAVTRGKAMLQCAKRDSAGDNIIERAKKLGVKIVPYLSLMKWLTKEQCRNYEHVKEAPPSAKKAKVEDRPKSKKLLCKARNLKQPFIKFEALNKFFRPVQMELNSWPYLNMNSTQGSCPFDDWLLGVNAVNSSTTQEATKRKNKKDVVGCWSAESEGQGDVPSRIQKVKKKNVPNQTVQQIPKNVHCRRLVNWERRKLAEKKLRQGFCECCEIRFDDVKKHLNSPEHLAFVKNESNYRQLDSLITNGYNVQQFVSNVSNHPKMYPENSSNSLEYSSPGRIVLLTFSSSTSAHINPSKSCADTVLKIPDVKPVCQAPTSESDSVTSENNGHNVSERQTKILSAKSSQTLIKDSCLLTACMKTPVKSTNRLLQDASPSLNGRSPLKCLLNSPSRLDFNTTEKEANKFKGPSTTWATSHSLFLPEIQQRHSKNVEWGTTDDQNENREIVKSAKYSSPSSQENFSVEQGQTREDHWKSLGKRTGETCVKATTALPHPSSVTACLTPTQPLSTNAGKNSLSPLLGNSSGSKCASLSLKRNFRCSSGKSKSRRLFKLGEKWKVLSQQSVKKILFSDESPESFTGFDPQDIFKNCDNSDVSYETVSEVILTDPSEFEWVLGNCEGRRVTEGTHSDPSSCFYNPQRNVPLRDPAVADYNTLQERSLAQENGLKKYAKSQEDMLVPFCGEDVKCLRKGMEHNFADGGTRESVNSDSPKNYDDNIEVYLNAHRDFPPYIPNGQTVGYCSQPFQQNSHIGPNLIADSQHYPANDFETKVIQDLDYLQTPRYLHLGTIDASISNYESGFDNRSVKHVYFSNSQHIQEFQYSDTTYSNLDVQAQDPLQNYSRLYNEATLEQSCSQSLNQSLEKTQASMTPEQCSLPNYKENMSVFGNNGQCKKTILPQTPLPNLSYECSSLSVMSVERTLNESDQNLDTPPDPPIGSSNSNNNQNSNSFEAIPVLNFDSSFNLPVQNFPVLSDFAQPEYNEERDFLSGTALKDSEPRNFEDQSCYNMDKSMADDNIIADSINNENEIDESNIGSHNKTEISFTDNIKCDNKIERNNISKTLAFYFNSYLTPPQDDKEYYSETVSTAETHSLISSLSQTAVSPLKKSQERQQTTLECRPDLPSAAKLSAVSPELQAGHKPDFLTEPLLENEMPQLTLGCELQTPPSPQIDGSSSYQKVLEQLDDDLDMPPQLQIEVQQPPLLLDSQHQLAPPKLKPEVTLRSQPKLCHSASQLEQKQPDSSPLFSSSPTSSSLPSITEPALQNTDLAVHGEDDYIELPALFVVKCEKTVKHCQAVFGGVRKDPRHIAGPHVALSPPESSRPTEYILSQTCRYQ
ncbi:PXDN [Acanthosepion pharaonis]|uniref:PXDN n=1 Tax=Acanthosepion pharaonis TaxID=158019 RepID=A0A812EKA4_ACAPH|nr:PXDN [Sepia pharaonis]